MSIPCYPEFKALELQDRAIIARHLKKSSRECCELALANIFIWREFDNPEVTCLNDNLCLRLNPFNEPAFFLEPLGRNRLEETVSALFTCSPVISRVSKSFIRLLDHKKYTFTPLRNHFDYLYLREELAEMKGKKFDGKRNHIKKLERHYPGHYYRPLTGADREAVLELFEKWFGIRSESRYFPKLAHTAQRGALEEAFKAWEKLALLGGGLFSAEGVMLGFTIGSKLNPETAALHFAYGDPGVAGVAPALFQAACRNTFKQFAYINLEQDLGIPGLRQSKSSYHPLKLVEKFEVKEVN